MRETTFAEDRQVEQWLNADPVNQAHYNGLKATWEASLQLAAVSKADENKAWERFRHRVHQRESGRVVQSRRLSPLLVAASVILLVGLTVSLYFVFNRDAGAAPVLVTSTDAVLADTLPDGSVVTLNKNSSLTYPSSFPGDSRNVELTGEAFFEVTPDQTKPFIITVRDIRITVLGTSFNVKSGQQPTEVIVETGVVKVTRDGQSVELHPQEKLVVPGKDTVMVKEVVSDQLYNYYRTREFVCDETPLWKLAEVIEEAYQVHIIFGRNELKGQKITTTFNNESLDKVLDIISLTFGIKITREGDMITLQ